MDTDKKIAEEIQALLIQKKMGLSLDDSEKEEYILTQEDELKVRQNVMENISRHIAWRFQQFGATRETILLKLATQLWDEFDYSQAYEYANTCKHGELWHKRMDEERKQNEVEARKKMVEQYNAKFMYNLMAYTSFNSFDKKLLYNEFTGPVIKAVCYFLSEDPRFETELGYSFKKGLWMYGAKGLGKTHCVRCVADNPLNPVFLVSTLEINEELRMYGKYKFETDRRILDFDDVGSEDPLVNYFGTKITFMKTFLETRYLKQKVYNNLIVSTNEDFNSIEDIYGGRVRSRLKDMFNIIKVEGEDMRGT